jgi:C-terminal processing protease CtpA/Prc
MKKMFASSAAAVLALAVAVPAFAGGGSCSGESKASSASMADHCAGKTTSAAWAGAWLQRSSDGRVMVADVAKGSPASKAGLKRGDLVLAVNGYDLSNTEQRAMCASKAACNVGSTLTYRVQRGRSTKDLTFKLAKMPSDATQRFASRQASFDPALAAVVMTSTN